MKCIIIEGPQGCGKTHLSNYLRENLASSNLYRLTGQKDKTITGKEKSKKMYLALLNYMKELESCDVNLIFDRTFFSEQVYGLLGYKEYDFTDTYEELLQKLGELNYEIYYISLYLENTELFRSRLIRESHHNYQAFSLENSVNQQNMYLSLIPGIESLPNTRVIKLPMDDFEVAYKAINELLEINVARRTLK